MLLHPKSKQGTIGGVFTVNQAEEAVITGTPQVSPRYTAIQYLQELVHL